MRRRSAVVLVATLFAVLATGVPALASEGEIVPSETCRGLWIVPATFGNETLDMVLDTGATSTYVDPDSLARLRGGPVEPGRKYTLRKGRIGPLEVRKMRVGCQDLDHLGQALGRKIDGILGMSTFRSVLLTLDYERGEVRVARGRLPPNDDREIFRDVGSRRPHLRVEVAGRMENVLIDSGSTGQFDLASHRDLEWVVDPRPVSAAARFSRIEVDEAGRMAGSVRFGPAIFEEPVVERTEGTSLAGYDVLRYFVWTFDHTSKRIQIRRSSAGPIRMEPLRGLGAAFHPKAAGFEVIQVFEGLPAAAAGIEKGDLVTHQDGVPIGERRCASPGDDPERKSVRLTVRREEATREIDVAVEALVP